MARPRNPPPAPPGLGYPPVKGQATAMRAFEIALAGGHSIGLVGCVGSGRHYLAGDVFPNVARCVMDSCPCGNWGSLTFECRCTTEARSVHYAVLAPVLLELAIIVEVVPVPFHVMRGPGWGAEDWENFHARVAAAQQRAKAGPLLEIEDDLARRTLELIARKMGLTCQQYVTLHQVARTIGHLAGARSIEARGLAEAAQYLTPAHENYWVR